MKLQAAVDVGGTFIDIVVADGATNLSRIAKVPHKPGSQGQDILASIDSLAKTFGAGLSAVDTLVIGTTVVTNALLEHNFSRTALITTEGFRDVLEIARMGRASSYDLEKRRPTPIVARPMRLEVQERISSDGSILKELSEASLTRHFETLKSANVEAIAVSLIFSFLNPRHERRVAEILSEHFSVPISLSSEVLATVREYERTSTTVVNATAGPIMGRFLDSLSGAAASFGSRLYIMGSESGCLTLGEARRLPARCTMSGPAGGVLGALRLAEQYELADVLTLDIGGTSTDVSLLRARTIPLTTERRIGGYAVALPSVAVETIGAGGGSIAYLDRTGLLKVGPQSAGGSPGPVCYGQGGTQPTLTDAHVALGRLGVRTMLGGAFEVQREPALESIVAVVADPAGLTPIRAAQGIVEVATANIVRAVRSISIERGHDPRKMTLIAFGGAGPLHAVDVARALGTPKVIVPLYPGVWSAFGILSADILYSAQRTWMREIGSVPASELWAIIRELSANLTARAEADEFDAKQVGIELTVGMRYKGQSHSLSIPLTAASEVALAESVDRFHAEHEQRFGHSAPGASIEVVDVHVAVRRPRPRIDTRLASPLSASAPQYRQVWFSGPDPIECPVYKREGLLPGQVMSGPAIVEQYDTTVVVSSEDTFRITEDGLALVIDVSISTQP